MLAMMGYSRGHGMRSDGTGLVKPIEIEVRRWCEAMV
jgi:hypothetical protein